MIFVGIDVAKDKHDCFILNSEGTVLADVFTIANNRIGFETLLSRIINAQTNWNFCYRFTIIINSSLFSLTTVNPTFSYIFTA